MARTQCFAEKRGCAWRGRYPDADGRMRSTSGYPTRAKALEAARAERARIEKEAARNATAAERAARGETTLAGWIAEIWPSWDIELTTLDLLQRLTARARRCRCPRRDDGTSACGSREPFVFLGAQGGHARRSNYAARVFRPAADGLYPAEKRRRGYRTDPWRVHCSVEPFPGIPVPVAGIHRAKAEQVTECCWAPLITGLTPHGLRHGHQTAMRRDRVPRVLRRDRLGHSPSGDIADHYTHIGDEMEMLACLTRRWQAAVTARARIDRGRGGEPCSAVPALDEWLALFRQRPGEIQLPFALPPARNRGVQS